MCLYIHFLLDVSSLIHFWMLNNSDFHIRISLYKDIVFMHRYFIYRYWFLKFSCSLLMYVRDEFCILTLVFCDLDLLTWFQELWEILWDFLCKLSCHILSETVLFLSFQSECFFISFFVIELVFKCCGHMSAEWGVILALFWSYEESDYFLIPSMKLLVDFLYITLKFFFTLSFSGSFWLSQYWILLNVFCIS